MKTKMILISVYDTSKHENNERYELMRIEAHTVQCAYKQTQVEDLGKSYTIGTNNVQEH